MEAVPLFLHTFFQKCRSKHSVLPYLQLKQQITLGMIVVTSMLFLHNVIGGLAYFSMDQLFSHEIFPYMLGVGIAELAGLLIFLKITLD